jgi:TPR repeat protein
MVKWLRKAADQGFSRRRRSLLLYIPTACVLWDYAETAKWLHKAADKGSTTGSDETVHVRQRPGVAKDPVQAARNKAAD